MKCDDVIWSRDLQRCSFGGFGHYRFMCRRCWGMRSQMNRVFQTFTDFRASSQSTSSSTGSESCCRGDVTKETDHRRHDACWWCSFLPTCQFIRSCLIKILTEKFFGFFYTVSFKSLKESTSTSHHRKPQ